MNDHEIDKNQKMKTERQNSGGEDMKILNELVLESKIEFEIIRKQTEMGTLVWWFVYFCLFVYRFSVVFDAYFLFIHAFRIRKFLITNAHSLSHTRTHTRIQTPIFNFVFC